MLTLDRIVKVGKMMHQTGRPLFGNEERQLADANLPEVSRAKGQSIELGYKLLPNGDVTIYRK